MKTEIPDTSAQYLEEFLKEHDISKIPEPIRKIFYNFLSQRAAARSMYLILPEESFSQGLGENNYSPRTELICQIEDSRLGIGGLNGMKITSWEYSETYPKEHEELLNTDKAGLIQFLDYTTGPLFSAYRENPDILGKVILIPFDRGLTGKRMIEKITSDEAFHLGRLVKFCDAANLPRTAALKKAWG